MKSNKIDSLYTIFNMDITIPSPSPLISIISTISTSNQWSVMESIIPKINKKLKSSNHNNRSSTITSQDVYDELDALDMETLELYGIWKHGYGTGTIICINPIFARVNQSRKYVLSDICICGAGRGHRDSTSNDKKYFESHDYNGGRHASTQSKHKANCNCWRPAPTSHLHSWRRGFKDGDMNKNKNRKVNVKRKIVDVDVDIDVNVCEK